jgi:hypothetical protein
MFQVVIKFFHNKVNLLMTKNFIFILKTKICSCLFRRNKLVMNMLTLTSKILIEEKDLNELTSIKNKIKFIFCLICQLKSSIKKEKMISSNKKAVLIFC